MRTRFRILILTTATLATATLSGQLPVDSVEAQGATLVQIDTAAERRAIDPRIYGVNWASGTQLQALNAPIHRWGGNNTSRYNWRQNADNRGSDWYFESKGLSN